MTEREKAQAVTFKAAFLDTVRFSAVRPGDTVHVLAQMLAVARRFPRATPGMPVGFFDAERELTSHEWHGLVSALQASENNAAQLPALHRRGSPQGGFRYPEIELEKRNGELVIVDAKKPVVELEPGVLERLRRLLIGIFPSPTAEGRAVSPPTWLIGVVLELATDIRSGELFLPQDAVQDLLCRLASQGNPRTFYCAFDSTAEIALRLAMNGADRVDFDVPSEMVAEFAYCLAVAYDLPISVQVFHPVRDVKRDNETLCEAAVAVPPMGIRYEASLISPYLPKDHSADALHLTALLRRTKGPMACLMADGFLFRSSSLDRYTKELFTSAGNISAVVSLPRGALPRLSVNASIIFRAKPGSHPVGEVLFVDARQDDVPRRHAFSLATADLARTVLGRWLGERSAIVGQRDLRENDFSLAVDRYVLDPGTREARAALSQVRTVALGDIAEIVRPQAVTLPKGQDAVREGLHAETEDDADSAIFREVTAGNINQGDGVVMKPDKAFALPPQMAAKARRAALEAGDILLSIKGRIGVVGLVAQQPPENETWLPGQSFAVVRLRRSSAIENPEVLQRYLSSPLGQKALQTVAGGTAVPFVQIADVRRLEVPIPSAEDLERLAEGRRVLEELWDQIIAAQERMGEIEDSLWPMNLAQSLNSDRRPGGGE
ncbi:N-6 DNA methylase [Falsiroseomonas sp.]|uniref:N-6 DNA methylase n=1 Tax=Falsiroseomonas sp. TaxID=2870721 RepID=UPI003F6E9BA8